MGFEPTTSACKRVVGSGLRAAEGLWLSGLRPLAAAFYLRADRQTSPLLPPKGADP